HLVLKQEWIFLDEQNKRMDFCYDTGEVYDLKKDFCELLEELMVKLNHEKREESEIFYALYQRVQEENCSLLGLQELFFKEKIKTEEVVSENTFMEDEYQDSMNVFPSKKREKKLWFPIENFLPKSLQNSIDKINVLKKKGKEEKIYYEKEKIPERREKNNPRQKVQSFCAKLIYLGKGEEKDFVLEQPIFLIGRDSEVADGVLRSAAVGRIQAKIYRREDGYYIEDMNSANGTLINGELLIYKNMKKLEEGDRITFADISYRFLTFCHNSII
ncbi:MAG: FHA domain-containing protein, partial [Lachnospiraceae bacterium]|nr:FHA domain-containing protein [Lachnospiraceae bacterium]